jgi:O-antigen/teichoic acid export membrane protein
MPPAHKSQFKNALVLMLGQVMSAPLSFLNSLIIARALGAKEFGLLYLAGNVCNFGFLFVEWGQGSVITSAVARNPDQAGEVLGSGLTWRVASTPVIYLVMATAAMCWHRDAEFQWALGLFALVLLVNTVFGAFRDVLGGFERMDLLAYGTIAQQVLNLVFVGSVLLLGGRMKAVLLAQAAATFVLVVLARSVLPSGVSPKVRLETNRRLLKDGFAFLALNLALALEPLIDSLFLARLGSVESMGWFSVASKLVGGFAFPPNALGTSFYPSWSRLWAQDRAAFASSVSTGLRASLVLGVPVGLGCLLYPDLGVTLFSRKAFGPAATDLRILSFFLFAFYITALGGIAMAAANRSRAWSICQFACPVVSLIADPLLIPFFQHRYGNGGLGVCVTTSVDELFLIASFYWLAPKGVFDRRFGRTLLLTLLAGAAMCASALLLARLPILLGAIVSVAAYGACLWATGGLDSVLLTSLRESIGRRFQRREGEPSVGVEPTQRRSVIP